MNPEIKLFSKKAIAVFALSVGPFFGSLLFADNLRNAGKKSGIIPVILFGFAVNLLNGFTLRRLLNMDNMSIMILPIISFVFQIIAAYILAVPLWKYFFGDIKEY